MRPNVAMLITSVARSELLIKCIKAWTDVLRQNEVAILVAEQGQNTDKIDFILDNWGGEWEHYALPYDCGISASRNFLVTKAHKLGYERIILGADSIFPGEGIKSLRDIERLIQGNIALVGFDIDGRSKWTYRLELDNHSFVLCPAPKMRLENGNKIQPCSICCNFFMADTKAVLSVLWDNELKAQEHEDFFWRFGNAGYGCIWTPEISGVYKRCRLGDYSEIRQRNMEMGKRILLSKYKIKKPFRIAN